MMKKVIYTTGQKLCLEMQKSEKGPLPIARTENGIICLINKECQEKLQINSIWDCKIIKVTEKYLIIDPIIMVVTPAANEYEAMRKLQALHKPVTHRKKIKANYQFASKVEQLKGF